MHTDRALLRWPQVSSTSKGPCRGVQYAGAHTRVFSPASTPQGGHIHTEMQGAGSAVPTLKNRWEVRGKGVI